jgi:hypothetical protein
MARAIESFVRNGTVYVLKVDERGYYYAISDEKGRIKREQYDAAKEHRELDV